MKTSIKLGEAGRQSDSEIANEARQAIAWITTVPEGSVKVSVREGWLELGGAVQTACEKNAAADAVKYVLGVKGVSNLIRVEPQACQTDAERVIHVAFDRQVSPSAKAKPLATSMSQKQLCEHVDCLAQGEKVGSSAPAVGGETEVDKGPRLWANPLDEF